MNRKFWIVAGLVIVTASVAGGFRTRATRHRTPSVSSNAAISAAEKFEADRIENDYREALSTVEENYAGEVDYEKATQAAIQGMLFTLDPHSVFFPTVEFKKLKEDRRRDRSCENFCREAEQGILLKIFQRSVYIPFNSFHYMFISSSLEFFTCDLFIQLNIPGRDNVQPFIAHLRNSLSFFSHKIIFNQPFTYKLF